MDGDTKKYVKEIIKREAEAMFLEAKRSLVYGSSSIPVWVIILLVVLGWNEFIAIISSPLYLFISLLLISSFFIIHHLRLSGPLMTAFNTISHFLTASIGAPADPDYKAKSE